MIPCESALNKFFFIRRTASDKQLALESKCILSYVSEQISPPIKIQLLQIPKTTMCEFMTQHTILFMDNEIELVACSCFVLIWHWVHCGKCCHVFFVVFYSFNRKQEETQFPVRDSLQKQICHCPNEWTDTTLIDMIHVFYQNNVTSVSLIFPGLHKIKAWLRKINKKQRYPFLPFHFINGLSWVFGYSGQSSRWKTWRDS